MAEGLHEGQRQLQLTLHFEHLIKRNQVKLLPGLTAPGSHHLSHSTPEKGELEPSPVAVGCAAIAANMEICWTQSFCGALTASLNAWACCCCWLPSVLVCLQPFSSSLGEVLMA